MRGPTPKILLPLSALILLAGCAAVGPDYSPPAAQLPASFGATPAGLGPGAVEVEWWRAFDEPALTRSPTAHREAETAKAHRG